MISKKNDMQISLTTPAILFPAVSLLLIAYNNRYLAIARLIRELKSAYEEKRNPIHLRQIKVLKKRERFISNMQAFAISSILLCTISMALIYFGEGNWADYVFGGALVLMVISLGISLREIFMAGIALKIELEELEELSDED
ncbi:MAG: DUF2721 domain-containing protein [Chitinophagales bacterium]